MAILATIISAMMLPHAALAGEISSVEVRGSEIVVEFDDVVAGASSFSLVHPDRIAIDIDGATAGKGEDMAQSDRARGFVHAIRRGQFTPDTARIVLDLDRAAVVNAGEFSSDGRSLRLSLVELGQGRFADTMRAGKKEFIPPAQYRAQPPRKEYSVRIRMPEPKEAVALPEISGASDPGRPLVVIDAGHGGHDPGAISPHGGKREKDITLALARELRDQLAASGRVRVALTRDSDKFLVLEERFGIARRMKADLFISIHADAAGSQEATGATVYTLSEVASDREAARLAARENKANVINGINLGGTTDDVSSILIDLTQRETMNLSADFARLVLREGEGDIKFRSQSHRFASFVVLKAPDVPSILLESGYLTNKNDLDYLDSAAGKKKLAGSLADAVKIYFARRLALN